MAKAVKGYVGKQLRVNLSRKEVKIEDIDPDVMKKFIGGSGYGVKLLYDELEARIDSLDPENKLIFATSPLSLNKVPGGGSIMLCFKSPVSGGWGESRCGGDFGPDLKRSGFDHVIIEGKSEDPVYLAVCNGKAEIRSAGHLVRKSVSEKTTLIKKDFPESEASVACIGIGGENLVRFASVMAKDRAAGRSGAGAVMGSKNLLGIAVAGTNEIEVAKPEKLKEALKNTLKAIKDNPTSSTFREFGTIGDMPGNDDSGDWPTKNWRSNSWGKGKEFFDYFQENNLIKSYGCYRGCPVACGRIVEVKNSKYQTPVHGGGEYESLSVFTSYVMNENMDAAVYCSYLCNEYGIDTISCGAVIAFAMECFERGVITKEDTGGLELSWGNAEALPVMVKMIAERKGLGDILAEGVRIASERLGGGSEEYAIQIKGLEGPAHDPRSGKALAVTYCTANRGMCHIHPVEGMAYDSGKIDFGMKKYGVPDPETVDRWDEEGKGKIIKVLQDGVILPDILSTCKFMMYCGVNLGHWSAILSALTGWDIEGKELLRIGERVTNLQRMFNVREGITREDDQLPARILMLPEFGKYKDEPRCVISNINTLLDEYYESRGWDKATGKPSDEKLKELGLL